MASANAARAKTIGVWILKGLVALLFAMTGLAKLSGQPMTVHEFDLIGFGQGFRVLTGLIEVLGAVMLLAPVTSVLGAAVLFCVSAGALIAQATRLHQDMIHPVVLMGVTGFLVWIGRRGLDRFTGRAATRQA